MDPTMGIPGQPLSNPFGFRPTGSYKIWKRQDFHPISLAISTPENGDFSRFLPKPATQFLVQLDST
jgi:hypothetical protein